MVKDRDDIGIWGVATTVEGLKTWCKSMLSPSGSVGMEESSYMVVVFLMQMKGLNFLAEVSLD